MLLNLHVKNLALIEEAEIEFDNGLNILTGETGAGKSVLLGSINLALGAKSGADLIGRHGDSAFVELNFSLEDEDKRRKLEEYDIFPEDGIVSVSRRIMSNRSIVKINGETVTLGLVQKITELLIDIHGQHDHQSLLYKSKHLEILDKYAGKEVCTIKMELESEFRNYKALLKELDNFKINDDEKNRAVSFLKFEIDEIDNAAIRNMEDVELEDRYRKMVNYKKIVENLNSVQSYIGNEGNSTAADLIGKAYQSISDAADYDKELTQFTEQIEEISCLLNDFNRDLSSYMCNMEFDEGAFRETEDRLDKINNLKAKYGGTVDSINKYRDEAEKKLIFYMDYENNLIDTQNKIKKAKKNVEECCKRLSEIRKKVSDTLEKQITQALLDLNFEQVAFQILITQKEELTINGSDDVEFMISMNPGEAVKPLAKIASGGELSRIMLGIKSVLADKDDIDTLIFDEIDTGISGRTAQKVSEKMALIAKNHQVICITHLPQIAAMADTNFLIEKNIVNGFSKTQIVKISDEGVINELARMLGGTEITDIVLENARQMKIQANNVKLH